MASSGRKVDDGSDRTHLPFSAQAKLLILVPSSAFGADNLGPGRMVTGWGWLEARAQQLIFPQGRVS